jgi:hypothetical protein
MPEMPRVAEGPPVGAGELDIRLGLVVHRERTTGERPQFV